MNVHNFRTVANGSGRFLRTILLLCAVSGCAAAPDKPRVSPRPPIRPRHVFFVTKAEKKIDIDEVNAKLDELEMGHTTIADGMVTAWYRKVAGARLMLHLSKTHLWIYAAVNDRDAARDVLQALLDEAADMIGITFERNGVFDKMVSFPGEKDETGRLEGMLIPQKPPKACLSFISKSEFTRRHGLEGNDNVRLQAEGIDFLWVARKGEKTIKEKAVAFVSLSASKAASALPKRRGEKRNSAPNPVRKTHDDRE